MQTNTHQHFMRRCLKLAYSAKGFVSPNPMVGAVIEHNGEIIAEGCHRRFGEPHAEVEALRGISDQSLLSQSTLYVNLEPCSHHGKTPPCVDAIVQAKIPKVVIGMIDPNPEVSGNGVAALQAKGVDVTTGILEEEAKFLNRRFITNQEQHRPYVILKWAETADGYIAREDGTSKWISGEASRKQVHRLRAEEDAIAVGTNTALMDDPQLTARGETLTAFQQPTRVFLDRTLRVPNSHHLYDGVAPTICFTGESAPQSDHVEFLKLEFDNSFWKSALSALYKRNIGSIIIEGGAKTLESLIDQDLWDEARVFKSQKLFEKGIKAPSLPTTEPSYTQEGEEDSLEIYFQSKRDLSINWL